MKQKRTVLLRYRGKMPAMPLDMEDIKMEESMEFEGKTPQEAAAAILDDGAYALLAKVGADEESLAALNKSEARIAEACQHFYGRGLGSTIDPQQHVRQFMAIAKQAVPERPQWPDDDTMDLRVRLKGEEFMEWVRDSGYTAHLTIERFIGEYPPGTEKYTHVFDEHVDGKWRDLPKSADALIDDLYVTIGTLLSMGIDMWPLWAEVQRANMAKTGGPVVNGKQMKPAGWTPPDIEGLLRKQGWEDEDGR